MRHLNVTRDRDLNVFWHLFDFAKFRVNTRNNYQQKLNAFRLSSSNRGIFYDPMRYKKQKRNSQRQARNCCSYFYLFICFLPLLFFFFSFLSFQASKRKKKQIFNLSYLIFFYLFLFHSSKLFHYKNLEIILACDENSDRIF